DTGGLDGEWRCFLVDDQGRSARDEHRELVLVLQGIPKGDQSAHGVPDQRDRQAAVAHGCMQTEDVEVVRDPVEVVDHDPNTGGASMATVVEPVNGESIPYESSDDMSVAPEMLGVAMAEERDALRLLRDPPSRRELDARLEVDDVSPLDDGHGSRRCQHGFSDLHRICITTASGIPRDRLTLREERWIHRQTRSLDHGGWYPDRRDRH